MDSIEPINFCFSVNDVEWSQEKLCRIWFIYPLIEFSLNWSLTFERKVCPLDALVWYLIPRIENWQTSGWKSCHFLIIALRASSWSSQVVSNRRDQPASQQRRRLLRFVLCYGLAIKNDKLSGAFLLESRCSSEICRIHLVQCLIKCNKRWWWWLQQSQGNVIDDDYRGLLERNGVKRRRIYVRPFVELQIYYKSSRIEILHMVS